ncbi:MAG TPA: 4-hydroxy-tetrahydrodipicolinate reductase [Dokdonella sp.]|nr:4-hydroxy-tetrahydrodipicolinate reductase [Dokdonella sp.]
MSDPIRLVVFGAAGRMGQAVLGIAAHSTDLDIAAAVVRPGPEVGSRNDRLRKSEYLSALPTDLVADAVIDFSGAGGFDAALEAALANRWALVSGSTGLSEAQKDAATRAAQVIPVLCAANFSLGVAVLAHLVGQAARLLPDWDCEIVEAHHRHKRDAPSGTALMLGERASAARGGEHAFAGPDRSGARPAGSIGYAVVRGGDIVGEHEVRMIGNGERIELVHRAHDRDIFARGAVAAARWLVSRDPGYYELADVLGLGE